MKFSFVFAISLFTLNLVGCSSLHSKLRKTQIGMFKKQALRKFGEPVEKHRSKGRDHWIYETQKKAKKSSGEPILYKHILIFEDGVVIDNKLERSFNRKELSEFYEKP